jgi:hypothetical protein
MGVVLDRQDPCNIVKHISHLRQFTISIVDFFWSQQIDMHNYTGFIILSVSFTCGSPSEFLVLTHNIPAIIISEKK